MGAVSGFSSPENAQRVAGLKSPRSSVVSSKNRSDSIARWFSGNGERNVDSSMSVEDTGDSHDDVGEG